MTTGAGTFEHYRKNGGSPVIRPITTTPVAERIRPSATPRKHESDAMLGKWVTALGRHGGPAGQPYGRPVERITGQVWSATSRDTGYGPGWWWIAATDGRYFVAHEDTFTGIAARNEDAPLFGEEMAS